MSGPSTPPVQIVSNKANFQKKGSATFKGNDFSHNQKWIGQTFALQQAARQSHCAVSIWDAKENRFLFFADDTGVLGQYDSSLFIAAKGLDFFLSHLHSGYIKAIHLIYEKCFRHCLQHLTEVHDTMFHLDVLYQKTETTSIQLLIQSMVVETGDDGSPSLFLNSIFDITHLKKERTATLVITSPHETEIWNYCFDKKLMEPARHLTPQEKKLLVLLSQRKGSKEMADILHTSHHTIDTQRRSLLQKTNCVDCTALITYAKMTGII